MTDTMPEQQAPADETGDWGDAEQSAPDATFPEFPANPHNHRFTISIDARGPMLVVRANTGAEIQQAAEELEDAAVGAAIGRAWAAFKAGAAMGNGLGAVPAQQGAPAPAAPGIPTPPPVPGAPGAAPAAWQNAGAPVVPPPPAAPVQNRGAEYAQAGWYRLNVPFPKKAEFDAITQQYGMRKGRPSEGGQFSFLKDTKAWYVDPQYAGAFPQFSPVPA
ncbi:hypothetical protein [Streptomyces misionensis]|uniref:hypothetical protein n=1 Tax=Streptomyces misionensis TaxID=67331 RepID=UPI0036A2A8D5